MAHARNVTRITLSIRRMALIAPWLFVLLATPPVAAAAKPADCALDERDQPTLDVRRLPSARFRMVTDPVGWERDESGKQVELTLRHGVETAALRDGVMLTVSLGGCETYTNAYTFTLPGDQPSTSDGVGWLLRASALLREIAPANLDRMVPLPALSEALASRAKDPAAVRDLSSSGLDGELDDGEASYRVELSREAGKTILMVSYSIRL